MKKTLLELLPPYPPYSSTFFKESEETSALEFLSSDGASYYLELTQDAAGEGLDLGDDETMEELQEEIIEYLEKN